MEVPVSRPPRPRRWRRRLFILLPILLLGGLAWWWFVPATLQRVGRYALSSASPELLVPLMQAGEAGFLVQEADATFCLSDWRTGAVRWRVTLPSAAHAGSAKTFITPIGSNISIITFTRYFALSQNGEYFASVTPEQGRLWVRCWRDGKPAFERRLPDQLRGDLHLVACQVMVTDRGCVYVQVDNQQRQRAVFRLDGSTVTSTAWSGLTFGIIDADEETVISYPQDICRMVESHGRLAFQQVFHAPSPLGYLLTARVIVLRDGRIYIRRGSQYRQAGKLAGELQGISHTGWIVSQDTHGRCRVQHPETGQRWAFTNRLWELPRSAVVVPGPTPTRAIEVFENRFAISDDGRRVLVMAGIVRHPPAWANGLIHRAPALARLFPTGPYLSLQIFERPGRLRARLLIPRSQPESLYLSRALRSAVALPLYSVLFAPDGRVVLFGPTHAPQGKLWYEVYRW